MTLLFALVAGYFALLFLLSLIARPSRLRLAELAHELACEELKPQHRRTLKALVDAAYSMRSAPAHLAAIAIALLTPSAKFDSSAREWAKDNLAIIEDKRWNELFDCHVVSIVAANPIFGAPLIVARLLFRMKAYLFAKRLEAAARPMHVPLAANPRALEMFGEFKPVAAAA